MQRLPPAYYRTVDAVDGLVLRVGIRRVRAARNTRHSAESGLPSDQASSRKPAQGAAGEAEHAQSDAGSHAEAEAGTDAAAGAARPGNARPGHQPTASSLWAQSIDVAWQQKLFGPHEVQLYTRMADDDDARAAGQATGRARKLARTRVAQEYLQAFKELGHGGRNDLRAAIPPVLLYTVVHRDGVDLDSITAAPVLSSDELAGISERQPDGQGDIPDGTSNPMARRRERTRGSRDAGVGMVVMAAVGIDVHALAAGSEDVHMWHVPLARLTAWGDVDGGCLLETRPGLAEAAGLAVSRAAARAASRSRSRSGSGNASVSSSQSAATDEEVEALRRREEAADDVRAQIGHAASLTRSIGVAARSRRSKLPPGAVIHTFTTPDGAAYEFEVLNTAAADLGAAATAAEQAALLAALDARDAQAVRRIAGSVAPQFTPPPPSRTLRVHIFGELLALAQASGMAPVAAWMPAWVRGLAHVLGIAGAARIATGESWMLSRTLGLDPDPVCLRWEVYVPPLSGWRWPGASAPPYAQRSGATPFIRPARKQWTWRAQSSRRGREHVAGVCASPMGATAPASTLAGNAKLVASMCQSFTATLEYSAEAAAVGLAGVPPHVLAAEPDGQPSTMPLTGCLSGPQLLVTALSLSPGGAMHVVGHGCVALPAEAGLQDISVPILRAVPRIKDRMAEFFLDVDASGSLDPSSTGVPMHASAAVATHGGLSRYGMALQHVADVALRLQIATQHSTRSESARAVAAAAGKSLTRAGRAIRTVADVLAALQSTRKKVAAQADERRARSARTLADDDEQSVSSLLDAAPAQRKLGIAESRQRPAHSSTMVS